jgi:hypothetical protein
MIEMFALLLILALVAAGRGAWALVAWWRLLPRRNADFGPV